MPYKAIGQWVYVERKGKWVKFKRHENAAGAKKHAAALNIHVHHPELAKKRKTRERKK